MSPADQITTDLWWNLPCRERKPPVRAGRARVPSMESRGPVANVRFGKRKAGTHIVFAASFREQRAGACAVRRDIEGHAVVRSPGS